MRRLVLATAAILAMALPLSIAQAADMAVKVPPPPPTPAATSDWTGLYFDVGVGWQYDHYNWTYTNFEPPQTPFSLSKGQGSFTGHIGYQQQFSWLVVGGEFGAFLSMLGDPATVTAPGGAAISGPCANVTAVMCKASITATDVAGGKLGVDWGNWLVYGVGGAAFRAGINSMIVLPSGGTGDTTKEQTAHGVYFGGGVDYLLNKSKIGDLIGGVEYEHVNLATVTACTIPGSGGVVTGCPGNPAATAREISATQDAVWGKLTVKFNPFN